MRWHHMWWPTWDRWQSQKRSCMECWKTENRELEAGVIIEDCLWTRSRQVGWREQDLLWDMDGGGLLATCQGLISKIWRHWIMAGGVGYLENDLETIGAINIEPKAAKNQEWWNDQQRSNKNETEFRQESSHKNLQWFQNNERYIYKR